MAGGAVDQPRPSRGDGALSTHGIAARCLVSLLAGGAVDQPLPPLWQSHNGAPLPSPSATALRAFALDPIAGRWGPVDPRHRCAMPGLLVGWRGCGPAPPPCGRPVRGPPPKPASCGAPHLRTRSHRGAMGPCRPTASLRDAWSPCWLEGLWASPSPRAGDPHGPGEAGPEIRDSSWLGSLRGATRTLACGACGWRRGAIFRRGTRAAPVGRESGGRAGEGPVGACFVLIRSRDRRRPGGRA